MWTLNLLCSALFFLYFNKLHLRLNFNLKLELLQLLMNTVNYILSEGLFYKEPKLIALSTGIMEKNEQRLVICNDTKAEHSSPLQDSHSLHRSESLV